MARRFLEAGGRAAGVSDYAAALCHGGDCRVRAEFCGDREDSRFLAGSPLGMTRVGWRPSE